MSAPSGPSPIGVLALQGGYEAHEQTLARLGLGTRRVRTERDLEGLAGLVLPGGESSTMLKLIAWNHLEGPLDAFVRSGKPVLATCAGLILCALKVSNPAQKSFGWLDVEVERNAWGRQNDSFEAHDDQQRFRMVFIRAPRIRAVGQGTEVVATLGGEPVAVRSRGPLKVVAASFHPELAEDTGLHRLAFT
jgi:5'-phosphate synthase pdxT subunit